jgi:hypothetical protein
MTGDIERRIPECKPLLAFDDLGREDAQLAQRNFLLSGDAAAAGGDLVFGCEVVPEYGSFAVLFDGEFAYHGLAVVDAEGGVQRLTALALPCQREGTLAHFGFQAVERFVALKAAVERLRARGCRECKAGDRNSVPGVVCHRQRVYQSFMALMAAKLACLVA